MWSSQSSTRSSHQLQCRVTRIFLFFLFPLPRALRLLSLDDYYDDFPFPEPSSTNEILRGSRGPKPSSSSSLGPIGAGQPQRTAVALVPCSRGDDRCQRSSPLLHGPSVAAMISSPRSDAVPRPFSRESPSPRLLTPLESEILLPPGGQMVHEDLPFGFPRGDLGVSEQNLSVAPFSTLFSSSSPSSPSHQNSTASSSARSSRYHAEEREPPPAFLVPSRNNRRTFFSPEQNSILRVPRKTLNLDSPDLQFRGGGVSPGEVSSSSPAATQSPSPYFRSPAPAGIVISSDPAMVYCGSSVPDALDPERLSPSGAPSSPKEPRERSRSGVEDEVPVWKKDQARGPLGKCSDAGWGRSCSTSGSARSFPENRVAPYEEVTPGSPAGARSSPVGRASRDGSFPENRIVPYEGIDPGSPAGARSSPTRDPNGANPSTVEEPATVPVCALCGNWAPGVLAGGASLALGLLTAGVEGGAVGAVGGFAVNQALTRRVGEATASGRLVGGIFIL